MKIKFLVIGKTDADYLKQGIDEYIKRLKHYLPFEMIVIPDLKNTKNLTEDIQKQKEGELISNQIDNSDFVVLLDEKGKKYSSVSFSQFIEKKMITGIKSLTFIVGGPYGFSQQVYQKCNAKLSLSDMTFSHQMVRLLFIEQFYRAMTIIRGEPYHHK
jgi:23S rRNA (pseudouridine1915-N3)-methyltransferase